MRELTVRRDGTVAYLAIDRSGQRNALNLEMWQALPELLTTATADPHVRVLVVQSAVEGVFSAGADLTEYRDHVGDLAWGRASQAAVGAALHTLRTLAVPTIAMIDGACVGGGAGIALACDLRIASTRARFGVTPARLGLVYPPSEIATLVHTIGPAAAKRLLFTADVLDAEWALRVGLVDELDAPESLEAAVASLTGRIAGCAPGSVRAMKELIRLLYLDPDGMEQRGVALVELALRGDEHREGVTAFLERRTPDF